MKEEIKVAYQCVDDIALDDKVDSISVFDNRNKDFVPQFTIAIPTFKRSDLLAFAINSVLRQKNCPVFDLLVVDNNPERHDETEDLMTNNYNKPNISYFKNKENLGMAGNWNKLYLLSRTKWVVMLHDDDMLYPEFLSVMSGIISHESENIACFYNCYVGFTGEGEEQPKREGVKKIKVVPLKETDFLTGCHVHAPLGMTLRRDVAIEMGGFNRDYYPSLDYHFHVKLSHFYPVSWLRGYPLASYRWLRNAGKNEKTRYEWIPQDNKVKTLIRNNNSSLLLKLLFNPFLRCFSYNYKIARKLTDPRADSIKKPSYIEYISFWIIKFAYGLPKHLRCKHTYTVE